MAQILYVPNICHLVRALQPPDGLYVLGVGPVVFSLSARNFSLHFVCVVVNSTRYVTSCDVARVGVAAQQHHEGQDVLRSVQCASTCM